MCLRRVQPPSSEHVVCSAPDVVVVLPPEVQAMEHEFAVAVTVQLAPDTVAFPHTQTIPPPVPACTAMEQHSWLPDEQPDAKMMSPRNIDTNVRMRGRYAWVRQQRRQFAHCRTLQVEARKCRPALLRR